MPATKSFSVLACLGAAALSGCLFGSDGNRSADSAFEESTFSKSYGGPDHDTATAVVASADGGFLLVGQANAATNLLHGNGGLRGDLWIQKLDGNGNIETQRLVGEQPIDTVGDTSFYRARPTADGGTILVGTRNSPDFPGVLQDRSDIAVSKLDAAGGVEWARAYDSGAWLNYVFFETRELTATPADSGNDIWPLPDGGYVVAGTSYANLEDRLGIGFPCPLVGEEDAGEDPCQTRPPGQPGGRFVDALSVVVLRLDADGNPLWTRRLTEEAFRLDNAELGSSQSSPNPVVRGTADGGAFIARTLRLKTLFQRLLPDGSPLPLTVVDDQMNVIDATQTDDPDAEGNRDGRADNGFVVAMAHVPSQDVLKIAADGSIEWRSSIGGGDAFSTGPDVYMSDIYQRCNDGGADCVIVVTGTHQENDEPFSTAYLAFLDDSGDRQREIVGPRRVAYERIQSGTDGSRYRLLVRNEAGEHLFQELVADGSELQHGGPTPGLPVQVDPSRRDRMPHGELTPAGGMLLFGRMPDGQRLLRVDERGSVIDDRLLADAGTAGETAVAAVEIAAGRFVIAAQLQAADTSSLAPGWLLRYDVDAAGDRVIWQRRLAGPGIASQVQALAASGDGGVVAAVSDGGGLRLAKLDANGQLLWQSPALALPLGDDFRWREVQRTPQGFAALAGSAATALLVTLDTDGRISGQRQYAANFQSFAPRSGGGFMLAASGGGVGNAVRALAVDGAGAPLWGRVFGPGGAFSWAAGPARIRQIAGGHVLAITETGILERSGVAGIRPYEAGDTNVLLMAIDDDGDPRWMRIYGALQAEKLDDLAVRDDGVILVAGSSTSFGERTEGWLMKLGPDGVIAPGCQAHLLELPSGIIEVAGLTIENRSFGVLNAPDQALESVPRETPVRTASGIATARQCTGSAGPSIDAPPAATFRLTVTRSGALPGTVTSTPSGIACGTGLGDVFCTAEFAAGTRVSLRADAQNFRRWLDACEDGTGGTSLDCAVTMFGNRTVRVQFGALPDGQASLAVGITGSGTGRVFGPGIDCPGDCSETYPVSTRLILRATPEPGSTFGAWSGDCESTGDLACVVAMDAARSVSASFLRLPP